jgi:hypothetical protein
MVPPALDRRLGNGVQDAKGPESAKGAESASNALIARRARYCPLGRRRYALAAIQNAAAL